MEAVAYGYGGRQIDLDLVLFTGHEVAGDKMAAN